MVTYEDFKKLDLRIGRITEIREHPNADRLYVMKVDLGDHVKQIVAGIRTSYVKEELLGRQIVVIDNLEPAVIRGEESQGMLLAGSDESGISVLTPHRELKPGSIVK